MRRCPVCNAVSEVDLFCSADGAKLVDAVEPTGQEAALGQLLVRLPGGAENVVAIHRFDLHLGKDPSNDVVIDDPAVSRRHATLRLVGGLWHIVDEGSRNGVFVNGRRVAAPAPVAPGDRITIGQTTLELSTYASPAEPRGVVPDSVVKPAPAARPAHSTAQRSLLLVDGRYRIEARIAQEETYTLYRARRVFFGDEVAVRLLRQDLASDPSSVERFHAEAKIAMRFSHPNVIRVLDFGCAESVAYIVQDLFAGRPLRQLLAERQRFTPSEALGIIRQVCDAAESAHAEGVLFCVIKPGGIYVDEKLGAVGTVKVGGSEFWRLASAPPNPEDATAMALQAPEYAAPELWLGGPLDERTDVYATGILLYELLVGRVPFEALMPEKIRHLHLAARVPDPETFGAGGLGPALSAAVLRALEKRPHARQPSTAALVAELTAAAG
jgi:hypothetical protein